MVGLNDRLTLPCWESSVLSVEALLRGCLRGDSVGKSVTLEEDLSSVSAPTLGSSRLPLTQAPLQSNASDLQGHLALICTYPHMYTQD